MAVFEKKSGGGDTVLNMQSIFEVAEYLSSTHCFYKKVE